MVGKAVTGAEPVLGTKAYSAFDFPLRFSTHKQRRDIHR
jgi:hypothetical protein